MSQAYVYTKITYKQNKMLTRIFRNTIQAPEEGEDDTIEGEFIGFTVEGGPIVRFNSRFAGASFPDNSELLGYCSDDRPIVAYSKDTIRFIRDPEKTAGKVGSASGVRRESDD